jgi:YD repeat-containing protein
VVQRAYDAGGRLSSITRSNGTTTQYTYDALSPLLAETHKLGTTVLSGQTNVYDLDDNALQSTSTAGGVTLNTL